MLALSAALILYTANAPKANDSVVSEAQFQADGRSFRSHWQLARTTAFRGVGVVMGSDKNLNHDIAASGVLIGKNYVLTCAHCACNQDGIVTDASKFQFVLALGANSLSFQGKSWHVVNGWRDFARTKDFSDWYQAAGDLAVLELEGTTGATPDFTPELSESRAKIGEDVCFVGFGARGTNVSGADEPHFGRGALDKPPRGLAFYQRIIESWNGGFVFKSKFDLTDGLKLQGQPSAGDSGGGVFQKNGDSWKLLGIITGSQTMETKSLGAEPFTTAKGSFIDISGYRTAISEGLRGNWQLFEAFKKP